MEYFQTVIRNTLGISEKSDIQPRIPTVTGFSVKNNSDYRDAVNDESKKFNKQTSTPEVPEDIQPEKGWISEAVVPDENITKKEEKTETDTDQNSSDSKVEQNSSFSELIQPKKKYSQEMESKENHKIPYEEISNKSDKVQDIILTDKAPIKVINDPIVEKDKPIIPFSYPVPEGKIKTGYEKENDVTRFENIQEGSPKKRLDILAGEETRVPEVILEMSSERTSNTTKESTKHDRELLPVHPDISNDKDKLPEITPKEIKKKVISDKHKARPYVTIGKINVEVVPPPPHRESPKVVEKEIIYESPRQSVKSTFKNNTGLKIRFGLGQI